MARKEQEMAEKTMTVRRTENGEKLTLPVSEAKRLVQAGRAEPVAQTRANGAEKRCR
jgi:hypothetical protein